MLRRIPIVALLLLTLCLAEIAEANKLPRKLCLLTVDAEAGEEWHGQTVLGRYTQLRKYLTARSPEISPLQFWIITLLADHPSTGLTAKELQTEFQRRGFTYAEGNIYDSVNRMATRLRYVKSRIRDQDYDPHFAATAEGIWEAVNLLGFYGKVRKIADKERRSWQATPIPYVTDTSEVPTFPVLGHTQATILASMAPGNPYWLQDFACDLIARGLGTPGAIEDVYATTKEMALAGLIRRVHAPGRPGRYESEEEKLLVSSLRGGEHALIQSLQFYEYSFQLLRADERMLLHRLLLEAADNG